MPRGLRLIPLLTVGGLLTVTGCVLPANGLVSRAADTALPAGDYWVDLEGATLIARPLDDVSCLACPWQPIGTPASGWFAGVGVYRVGKDGGWTPRALAPDVTLDDFLQTFDPAPAVP